MKVCLKHLRAGLAVLSLLSSSAVMAQQPTPADAPATRPGLAEDLRGDAGAQKGLSDIDAQIERTWRLVEEVRENAVKLRLAHASLKDALENDDCNIAAKSLQTLKRSREGVNRLAAGLEAQCKDVDPAAQKQLAQACADERATLQKETKVLDNQFEQVLGRCPSLRK